MSYVRKPFDEMSSRGSGVVKLARRDLGITAFGMQVFDFPPGAATPEHTESGGQEEVYVGLSGSGWVEVEGEQVPLGPRVAVSVMPGTSRRTVAGPDGLSFLAVGAVPHGEHEAPAKFQ